MFKRNNKSSNNNVTSDRDSLQRGNLETQGVLVADKPEEDLTEGQDQGVHQSKRRNKGTTGRYKYYSLMMNARRYNLMMNVQ